ARQGRQWNPSETPAGGARGVRPTVKSLVPLVHSVNLGRYGILGMAAIRPARIARELPHRHCHRQVHKRSCAAARIGLVVQTVKTHVNFARTPTRPASFARVSSPALPLRRILTRNMSCPETAKVEPMADFFRTSCD